jgi:hypothetical protein
MTVTSTARICFGAPEKFMRLLDRVLDAYLRD